MAPKVLLISPPWQDPKDACLALATLKPLLEAGGIATDLLHGSTIFPYTTGHPEFLNFFSAFLFAPHLYPEIDRRELLDAVVNEYIDYNNASGILYPSESVTYAQLGGDALALRAGVLTDIERAGVAVERCTAVAADPVYDVVGFSVTFESQMPAALAVARRLKALRPDVKVIVGGAACFEEQGLGLAVSFPLLDAVCHCEGERTIVPLVRALREGTPLAEVPGIAYLDAEGALRHTPSPPLLVDMDTLPIPEFEAFLEQYAASPWASREAPTLYFETSRGCWWGQKHLCTFCGLNAEGVAYRRKTPDRAYREIATLHERYPGVTLQATDNILDMSYIDEVMPRLAELARTTGRPPRIFYEVKSNLRRDQLQKLADAGVTDLQPGIEAFSDEVLALMDKGATAAMQVRLLKWATEADISCFYNIIVRNPGEKAEWYTETTAMLPYIEHLPPPVGVVAMMLERFSPYFTHPERYGLARVRPKDYYRTLYPDPAVDLSRIAYVFDFDHEGLKDASLIEAQRAFLKRLVAWRASYEPHRVWFGAAADTITFVDERRGARRRRAFSGVAIALYRFLDPGRPQRAIDRQFAELDLDVVGCLLDTWSALRLVYRDRKGRSLAVICERRAAPPAAPAYVSATSR